MGCPYTHGMSTYASGSTPGGAAPEPLDLARSLIASERIASHLRSPAVSEEVWQARQRLRTPQRDRGVTVAPCTTLDQGTPEIVLHVDQMIRRGIAGQDATRHAVQDCPGIGVAGVERVVRDEHGLRHTASFALEPETSTHQRPPAKTAAALHYTTSSASRPLA